MGREGGGHSPAKKTRDLAGVGLSIDRHGGGGGGGGLEGVKVLGKYLPFVCLSTRAGNWTGRGGRKFRLSMLCAPLEKCDLMTTCQGFEACPKFKKVVGNGRSGPLRNLGQ